MHTLIDTLRNNKCGEPVLYGISDRRAFPALDPREYLALLFRTRAHILQWREKDLTASQSRDFVGLGNQLAGETGKLFLVNSWVDLALQEGTDGVHLTSQQTSDEVTRARSSGNPDFLVGKSVHGWGEAEQALEDGVDYLLVGPIYAPLSKPSSLPPLGLSALTRIVRGSGGTPVLALGGIEESNLTEVLSTGAVGVAGISWLRREVERLLE